MLRLRNTAMPVKRGGGAAAVAAAVAAAAAPPRPARLEHLGDRTSAKPSGQSTVTVTPVSEPRVKQPLRLPTPPAADDVPASSVARFLDAVQACLLTTDVGMVDKLMADAGGRIEAAAASTPGSRRSRGTSADRTACDALRAHRSALGLQVCVPGRVVRGCRVAVPIASCRATRVLQMRARMRAAVSREEDEMKITNLLLESMAFGAALNAERDGLQVVGPSRPLVPSITSLESKLPLSTPLLNRNSLSALHFLDFLAASYPTSPIYSSYLIQPTLPCSLSLQRRFENLLRVQALYDPSQSSVKDLRHIR